MAITTAVCNSFKTELFNIIHNFAGVTPHTFKIALFTSAATLSKATTAYAATNEASDTSGNARYTAGGATLATVAVALSTDTAYVDWDTDPTWGTDATITANGCLIYNSSASNKAVASYAFGADKTCTTGSFTITLPAPGASAVLTLA